MYKLGKIITILSIIMLFVSPFNLVVAETSSATELKFDVKSSGLILNKDDTKIYTFNLLVNGAVSIDFKVSPTGVQGKEWQILIIDSEGRIVRSFDCDDSSYSHYFNKIELVRGTYTLKLQPKSMPAFLKYSLLISSSEVKEYNQNYVHSPLLGYKSMLLRINDPYIYHDSENPTAIDDTNQNVFPVIENSRTLLPIRAIVEKMGGYITWNNDERKVSIMHGSNTIYLWIDSNTAVVNNVEKELDVAPKIIQSRTFIPLRFVAENLGATVTWLPETKSIKIEYQIVPF